MPDGLTNLQHFLTIFMLSGLEEYFDLGISILSIGCLICLGYLLIQRFEEHLSEKIEFRKRKKTWKVETFLSVYLKCIQLAILQPLIAHNLNYLDRNSNFQYLYLFSAFLTIVLAFIANEHDYDFSFKIVDNISKSASSLKTLDIIFTIIYCFGSQSKNVVLYLMPIVALFRIA